MVNVEKYINELLYQYDCVIVPDLGGFVAIRKNAQINKETGVFNPPCREIGFNSSLSHNDGLLIDYVSSKINYTYKQTSDIVFNWVLHVKEELKDNGLFNLGDLGEFTFDVGKNIIFHPGSENLFSAQYFGLSTFNFETLKQQKERENSTRNIIFRTLNSDSFKQTSVAAMLLLGFLFVTPKLNNPNQEYANMVNTLIVKQDNINNELNTNISSLKAEELNEVKVKKETEISNSSTTEIETPKHFGIIIASHKYKGTAKKHLKEIKAKGFDNAQLIHKSGRYRVAIDAFATKQEAQENIANYKKQKQYKDAWISFF